MSNTNGRTIEVKLRFSVDGDYPIADLIDSVASAAEEGIRIAAREGYLTPDDNECTLVELQSVEADMVADASGAQ